MEVLLQNEGFQGREAGWVLGGQDVGQAGLICRGHRVRECSHGEVGVNKQRRKSKFCQSPA